MAISNMISQVWAARILDKLQKNLVFAQEGVVTREWEGDIQDEGDRVHIHSFADLTVSNYVKNSTTINYEQLTDARVTLLIDQSKYFAFRVDDIEAVQMKPKLLDSATARGGYQLSETADRYVASLYGGVSSSGPDNVIENSAFTADNIYTKLVQLGVMMDEVNIPAEGRWVVLPPWAVGLLQQNATFLAAKSDTVLNGEVGQVAGIRVLKSNNVPTTGTSPVVSHCLAGHASGLAYAEQIVEVEGLRLEDSFSDAVRGLHLYGAKVLDGARLFDLQANP